MLDLYLDSGTSGGGREHYLGIYVITGCNDTSVGAQDTKICALHSGSDAILQGQARHCWIKQQFHSLSDRVALWFAFFFSFKYED